MILILDFTMLGELEGAAIHRIIIPNCHCVPRSVNLGGFLDLNTWLRRRKQKKRRRRRTGKSGGENDNEFVTLIFIFMELRRHREIRDMG